MNKLTKDHKTLYYSIEEKNNKHTYFKPKNGYLLITKAKNMSLKQIISHLDNNFLKYVKLTKLVDDNKLNIWGKAYNLKLIEDNSFFYEIINDNIIVNTNINNIKIIKIKILTKELKKYLKNNRNKFLNVLTKHQINEVPITLKFLTSKFGSYHYLTNKIVLNVFLATLEPIYVDYVIYHEYAHQKEKNHQKDFYMLLEKMFTNYKTYHNNLKKQIVKI